MLYVITCSRNDLFGLTGPYGPHVPRTWAHGRMDEQSDGQTVRQTDRGSDGRMDGRTDGRNCGCPSPHRHLSRLPLDASATYGLGIQASFRFTAPTLAKGSKTHARQRIATRVKLSFDQQNFWFHRRRSTQVCPRRGLVWRSP